MKKLVCLILALTMVLALCACGAKTEEAPVAEAPVEEAAVETVDEAAEEPNGIVPGTVINFAAPVGSGLLLSLGQHEIPAFRAAGIRHEAFASA